MPLGAPSLPTHPTQIYEGGVALLASLTAGILYFRGVRSGWPFALWVGLYGIGRFLIEFLRDDFSRGMYHGWSSAQYISIGLCLLVSVFMLHYRRLLRAEGPRLQAGGA